MGASMETDNGTFPDTPSCCRALTSCCDVSPRGSTLETENAALTCPVKIASGKFHGLMHTNAPRPRSR